MKTGILIILLAISFLVIVTPLTTFQYTFDTISRYAPSYPLGYIYGGYTLLVNISTTGTGPNKLSIDALSVIVEQDTWPTTGLTAVVCTPTVVTVDVFKYFNCSITSARTYRVNITSTVDRPATGFGASSYPLPNIMQSFQFSVSSAQTGKSTWTTLLKSTDTIRNRIAKLIYIDFAQNAYFNLYPAIANATNTNLADYTQASLTLWKVNPLSGTNGAFDISQNAQGRDAFNNTAIFLQAFSLQNQILSYGTKVPLSSGFYVLSVEYKPTNINFVKITFPSDPYTCPYPPEYPDTYSNFQPCTSTPVGPVAENPGYPCLSFNTGTRKCTSCAGNYILSNGICSVNTECPARQYYHFGNCYPVKDSCDAYDSFTGNCLTCKSAIQIVVNGNCVDNPAAIVICGARQVKINNVCINVNPLCDSFNLLTGGCITCVANYQLSGNGDCIIIPIPTCLANEYLVGRTCVKIPDSCPDFNKDTGTCRSCGQGYFISNGQCEKIVCPPGQIPSKYGIFCIAVSPTCDNYDQVTGECLSCKNSNYHVSNGICTQFVSPLAGCQQRMKLGYGECANAQVNCKTYNLISGECDQCKFGYFKDYEGVCSLQSDSRSCRSDEVNIQGYCIQLPVNCRSVNSLGLCTQCEGNQYQIVNGQCVFSQTCGNNQYLSNGQCVDIAPGCTQVNPSTGVCLTCSNGESANAGLCCRSGQVVYAGQCVTQTSYQEAVNRAQNSEQPTCIAWHQTLGFCLQCNGNYQVNPATFTSCF